MTLYLCAACCFTGNFPMIYCCKDYKNVTRDKKFLQNRFFVCFWKFLLKYKKVFKLGSRKFHFLKYKELFKSFFFIFLSSESYFLKFFSLVIRKFRFPKYKKLQFLKYKEFFSGWIFLFF